MTTQTYARRAKLALRLASDLDVLRDCTQRFADNLTELPTDVADMSYMERQLSFAAERVQIMRDRLADYLREYPAELEQREC